MNEIIVAIITGGITLVGVLLANQKTQAVERTEEELEEDRAARPEPEPTEQEQLRADVDFLLAMGGVL